MASSNLVTACLPLLIFLHNSYAGTHCDTTESEAGELVVCSTFTGNGSVFLVRSYLNGQKHGFLKQWYPTGELRSIAKYNKGCKVDTSFMYHKSGAINRITPYGRCEEDGVFVVLSDKGDTLAIGLAVRGKSIGRHRAWFESGKKKHVVNYDSTGERHGLYQEWREDGTRKDSLVYHHGKIIEERRYFENGQLGHWIKYKNGKLMYADHYTPEGKPAGKIRNGSGKVILISEDGDMRWLEVFKAGQKVKSRNLEPDEKPSLK